MRANLEDNIARRIRHTSALFSTIETTLLGTYRLARDCPQFHYLNPGSVDRDVFLPPLEPGGGQFYIISHQGTTNKLNIRDVSGVLLKTLDIGDTVRVTSSRVAWHISVDLSTGVSITGSPTTGQWAQFSSPTSITGVATASMPFVQKAGDTMTGQLQVSNPASSVASSVYINSPSFNSTLNLNTDTSHSGTITLNKGGLSRWTISVPPGETGGDTGSAFTISRFHDDGTPSGTMLQLFRNTDQAYWGNDVAVQKTTPVYTMIAAGTNDEAMYAFANTDLNNRRWAWTMTGEAESGSNAGSNLKLTAYADSPPSTVLSTPIVIARSTGLVTLIGDPTAALGAATKQYADLKIAKSGDTMTGDLTIAKNTPQCVLNATGAGDQALFNFKNGGSDRWNFYMDNTAESGTNVGSRLVVANHSAAGSFIGQPLIIARDSGVASFSAIPVGPASDPTTANQLTRKSYVDAVPIPNYLGGLTLVYGGINTITVNTGGACSDDATNTMVLSTAITKSTAGVWSVGTGVGGMDTGTIAANTWYHVWLIKRTDTGVVDALFSLSASAPTMPASYTKKRRLGSFKTDGSSNILSFVQFGDEFIWSAVVTEQSNAAIPTSATLLTLVAVPTGVKVRARISTSVINSATGGGALFQSPDENSAVAGSPVGNVDVLCTTAANGQGTLIVRTNT